MRFFILLLGLIPLVTSARPGGEKFASIHQQEEALTKGLRGACGRAIDVDLSDYMYSTDEQHSYDYPGLESCQRIVALLSAACTKHSKNIEHTRRVKTVFCKRGSLYDRRLIVRKTGDVVLLSSTVEGKGIGDVEEWLKAALGQKLKIDFAADEAKEIKLESEKQAAAAEKAANDQRAAKSAEQSKKVEVLTKWFQEEVKQLTTKPTPDMGLKIEKLKTEYEEKLNALTAP